MAEHLGLRVVIDRKVDTADHSVYELLVPPHLEESYKTFEQILLDLRAVTSIRPSNQLTHLPEGSSDWINIKAVLFIFYLPHST